MFVQADSCCLETTSDCETHRNNYLNHSTRMTYGEYETCHSEVAFGMQRKALTRINMTTAENLAATFQPKELTMTKIAATQMKRSDETPLELQEMAAAIESLPPRYRDAVAPALARVVECSTRRRRILNLVQEALSQLRLDMKYLIFDLEATRRERDQYKETLERDGRL